MTRQHNGHQEATPFSAWLRRLETPLDSSHISNQNLDYVWHDYRQNYILTIEEKRFGAIPTIAQRDTHNVLAQMLGNSDGIIVQTLKGRRAARYFGHYVVSFENTTPDDGKLWINSRLCTRDRLLLLLSFDAESVTALKKDAL